MNNKFTLTFIISCSLFFGLATYANATQKYDRCINTCKQAMDKCKPGDPDPYKPGETLDYDGCSITYNNCAARCEHWK